jgi:hypothetical protein
VSTLYGVFLNSAPGAPCWAAVFKQKSPEVVVDLIRYWGGLCVVDFKGELFYTKMACGRQAARGYLLGKFGGAGRGGGGTV